MMTTRSLNSTLDRVFTLNRALDHMLSDHWNGASAEVWVPAIDVVEKKEAYLMYVELPGAQRSQIAVSFEKGILTISGTKPAIERNDGETRIYVSERMTGTFERSVRVPEFVDAEHISATFVDGLLTVTVPKAQAAQPRKIQVQPAVAGPTTNS